MQFTKGWVKYSITFTHPAAVLRNPKYVKISSIRRRKWVLKSFQTSKISTPTLPQLASPAMRGIFGFCVWSKTTYTCVGGNFGFVMSFDFARFLHLNIDVF